ncbi:MAG TPA: translesion error-prone DNA polymerase V autoproteolytic subunit [Bacteroidales bacterium]|nr:translesion error-prone DNA polymerase V autoproteolytic subunit [Bacteroidales bacterium]HPS17548.1 translesion error-prone DNA polymerase V autoproteolytic subunit [Bacteroidales bacterium]
MKKQSTIKPTPMLEFFKPDKSKTLLLKLFTNTISAGFPSPAEDFLDKKLDLNEYLIKNPSATFLVRVNGNSMIDAGIFNGDILIVDRSVEATNGRIVIGVINGEFTVKRIIKSGKKVFLKPENEKFKPIELTEDMDFKIWGVVIYTIHKT